MKRNALRVFCTIILSELLLEGSFKIDGFSFFFVGNSEGTGEQGEVDPFVELTLSPVDATIDLIFVLSLTNIGGHIGDRTRHVWFNGVSNQSVLLFLLQGLESVSIDFFSEGFGTNGGKDRILSTLWEPAKVDEEFTIVVFDKVELLIEDSLEIVGAHNKWCHDEIAFLFSSVTFDQESTCTNDSIKVNLFAIPIVSITVVKVLLD